VLKIFDFKKQKDFTEDEKKSVIHYEILCSRHSHLITIERQ